jgi:hypothetical protein
MKVDDEQDSMVV